MDICLAILLHLVDAGRIAVAVLLHIAYGRGGRLTYMLVFRQK